MHRKRLSARLCDLERHCENRRHEISLNSSETFRLIVSLFGCRGAKQVVKVREIGFPQFFFVRNELLVIGAALLSG